MSDKKITKQDIIEFGFVEVEEEVPYWPFHFYLTDEKEDGLMIVVTLERNTQEFALIIPEAGTLFLRPQNLDDLYKFIQIAESFDPNY